MNTFLLSLLALAASALVARISLNIVFDVLDWWSLKSDADTVQTDGDLSSLGEKTGSEKVVAAGVAAEAPVDDFAFIKTVLCVFAIPWIVLATALCAAFGKTETALVIALSGGFSPAVAVLILALLLSMLDGALKLNQAFIRIDRVYQRVKSRLLSEKR